MLISLQDFKDNSVVELSLIIRFSRTTFLWDLVVLADIILIIADPPELIPSKDPSAQCRLHQQETEFVSEGGVL